MAFRTYRRRVVRRPRRRYTRVARVQPRYGRLLYRRRRTPFYRRRGTHVQNVARYTTRNYFSEHVIWPDNKVVADKEVPITDVTYNIDMNRLFDANRQFLRNLHDYQYVKLNYIVFKLTSIAHIGFDREYKDAGIETPFALGVNTISGDIPIYVTWDLESRIDINKTEDSIPQYEYTKKMSPCDKKPVTLMYHVPVPWRQFYMTANFRSTPYKQSVRAFMESLSGVRNLRCPTKVYMTVKDFWKRMLPYKINVGANLISNIQGYVYAGWTFRGRTTQDTISTSYYQEPVFCVNKRSRMDEEDLETGNVFS